jgi:hypothetical protein
MNYEPPRAVVEGEGRKDIAPGAEENLSARTTFVRLAVTQKVRETDRRRMPGASNCIRRLPGDRSRSRTDRGFSESDL